MQKYQNRFNKNKKIVIWMSEGSLPGGSILTYIQLPWFY
jgi:hypothetical protein